MRKHSSVQQPLIDKPLLDSHKNTDSISSIIYILQLDSNCLTTKEVSEIIVTTRKSLIQLDIADIQSLFYSLKFGYIKLGSFKVYIRHIWLAKLMLVSAFSGMIGHQLEASILQECIREFRIDNEKSIYLLQTILTLLNSLELCPGTAFGLLTLCQQLSMSDFKSFKNYKQLISQKVLQNSSIIENYIDIKSFPIKGIKTNDLQTYLQKQCAIKQHVQEIVEKIIKMFGNNVENRDGGFIYKVLISQYEFQYWKLEIWPKFYEKFLVMDLDGEFNQSLIKYWIPQTVTIYQLQLYDFYQTTSIPNLIKGQILLELKKQFALVDTSDFVKETLFSNENINHIGFSILTTCPKGKLKPCSSELSLLLQYLEEHILDHNDIRRLSLFLQQLIKLSQENVKAFFKQYIQLCLNLILKTERRNFGAQLLLIILIDEDTFSFLNKDDELKKNLQQLLIDNQCRDEYLAKLSGKLQALKDPQQMLLKFIGHCSNDLQSSITVANSVQNLARYIGTVDKELVQTNITRLWIQDDLHDINRLFQTNLWFVTLNEVVHEVDNEFFDWVCTICFPNICELLKSKVYRQSACLKSKSDKIAESLFGSVCTYLSTYISLSGEAHCPLLIQNLILVIETSNMKRPTTISSDLLHAVLVCMNGDVKIELLLKSMEKLVESTPVLYLTIRRSPEIRLILYAICTADSTPNKIYVNLVFHYLLGFLSDENSKDSTISASLHSLESLISDNSLSSITFKFIPQIVELCFKHWKTRNWIVRNACIQLEKALIDRFLGVRIAENQRTNSIEDLFALFPCLQRIFFSALIQEPLDDSALGAMQFFCESKIVSPRPFTTSCWRKGFLKVLAKLIKEQSNCYGQFAARAYVAICPHNVASLDEIVEYVLNDFKRIKQTHSLNNFIVIIRELAERCPKSQRVLASLDKFKSLLDKTFHIEQLNMVLVKTISSTKALQRIDQFDINNYKDRLFLHNYCHLLGRKDPVNVLWKLFDINIPEICHIKFLLSAIEQFSLEVLHLIVRLAISSPLNSFYFSMCNFKIIYNIFESLQVTPALINQCRNSFQWKNPYQRFICVLIISQSNALIEQDKHFINLCIKNLTIQIQSEDIDFLIDLSKMLKYFYVCSQCLCQKQVILEISISLLLKHNMWHFIQFICKKPLSSATRAIKEILSYKILRKFFDDDDEAALNFVIQFQKCYHASRSKCKVSSTFYEEQIEDFVPSDCVCRCIMIFLYDFATNNSKTEWLSHFYENCKIK